MEEQFVVKEFNVRPVMKRAYCPDCDEELEKSPVTLSTFPVQFQYFCTKCGYGYTSTRDYPAVEFVSVDEEQEVDNDEENSVR